MRVPEISLGYGLLAQNKHDLCRYYKYTERHKQTQYLPAYTVSFMVVPSVRAWEFSGKILKLLIMYSSFQARLTFLSLTVSKRKNRCIPCAYLGTAIFIVVIEYCNLFPSFTLFLNCFHFTFGYELIVCSKSTSFMKIICNGLAFICRNKSLFLNLDKIYCFQGI